MAGNDDELDAAFGPDQPQQEFSGDELEEAFKPSPPPKQKSPYQIAYESVVPPSVRAGVSAADVGLSGLKQLANKVTGTLVSGSAAMTGGNYMKTKESYEKHPAFSDTSPLTESGKELGEVVNKVAPYTGIPYVNRKIGEGIEAVAGPEARDIAESAMGVAGLLSVPEAFGLKSFGKTVGTAERVASTEGKSVGAAAAAADVSRSSPEIQAELSKINPKNVDSEVLKRHLRAEQEGVTLTEGQATRDPDIITEEQNTRGATGLSQHFDAQAKQLKQRVSDVRDEVGPEVFSTNDVEHGDTLIQAYKNKDEPIVADIRAKYKALEDANGGSLPIDGKAVAETANAMLRKKLKSNYLPSAVASDLNRFATGEPMTFEDFEAMRTNLAAEIRKAQRSGDGNSAAAAGIVRDALENFPLQGAAERLKPLADAARGAAKTRFDALRADPAYEASVNDTLPPDRFVEKFVTGKGATRDNVARMRANLAGDDTALQTLGVATVDALRDAAGIDRAGNGKFSQARYNKRLESLDPKLQSLLPPDAIEHMRNLGEIARDIQEQPAGASVNNSGTLSGAIAKFGVKAAETGLAIKSGGLSIPIVGKLKEHFNANALAERKARALKPLAGVDKTTRGK